MTGKSSKGVIMNRKKLWILVLITAMMFSIMPTSAKANSQGAYIKQFIKYIKTGNNSKASSVNKKIKPTLTESYVSKMTKKQKAVFQSKYKSYKKKFARMNGDSGKWFDSYLADLDGDKKVELLICMGESTAVGTMYVFRFKSGKAKKAAQTSWNLHGSVHAYPGHKGIIVRGWSGVGNTYSLLTLKNNKIKYKKLATDSGGAPIMNGELKSYKSNIAKAWKKK